MAISIVLLACIPAYLLAGLALVLGASWITAGLVLVGTGCAAATMLAVWLLLRDGSLLPDRSCASSREPDRLKLASSL